MKKQLAVLFLLAGLLSNANISFAMDCDSEDVTPYFFESEFNTFEKAREYLGYLKQLSNTIESNGAEKVGSLLEYIAKNHDLLYKFLAKLDQSRVSIYNDQVPFINWQILMNLNLGEQVTKKVPATAAASAEAVVEGFSLGLSQEEIEESVAAEAKLAKKSIAPTSEEVELRPTIGSFLLDEHNEIPLRLAIEIGIAIAEEIGRLHKVGKVFGELSSRTILFDKNTLKAGEKIQVTLHRESPDLQPFEPWEPRTNLARFYPAEALTPRYSPAMSMDVFMLGRILWQLVARSLPFAAEVNNDIVTAWVVAGEQECIPDEWNSGYAAIIKSCWAPANQRPTISALLHALRELLK